MNKGLDLVVQETVMMRMAIAMVRVMAMVSGQ